MSVGGIRVAARARMVMAGAAAVTLVALTGCSDSPSEESDPLVAACEEVGGTLVDREGDQWTCEQIAIESDERYGELTEYFTPLCVAPNVITSGWNDEAMTKAGWSCSPEPDLSAGFGTLEEACASVGGDGSVGDVEGWWWCEFVPVESDEEYAAAEAAVAPFCPTPNVFRSEPMNEQGSVLQWWCEGAEGTEGAETEEPPTVDNVCAQLAGVFVVNDDGRWTCDNVPINAPSDYEAVDNLFLPYCPAPAELTRGMRTENPETAGWTCSPFVPEEQTAESLDEACALLFGVLSVREDGGWTCGEVALISIDNYPIAENVLAPFCVAPMVLTSGMLSDDPPVAGWSCSPA